MINFSTPKPTCKPPGRTYETKSCKKFVQNSAHAAGSLNSTVLMRPEPLPSSHSSSVPVWVSISQLSASGRHYSIHVLLKSNSSSYVQRFHNVIEYYFIMLQATYPSVSSASITEFQISCQPISLFFVSCSIYFHPCSLWEYGCNSGPSTFRRPSAVSPTNLVCYGAPRLCSMSG